MKLHILGIYSCIRRRVVQSQQGRTEGFWHALEAVDHAWTEKCSSAGVKPVTSSGALIIGARGSRLRMMSDCRPLALRPPLAKQRASVKQKHWHLAQLTFGAF